MTDLAMRAGHAADALKAAASGVDPVQAAVFVDAIATPNRVVLHGVGREGLMMRARQTNLE